LAEKPPSNDFNVLCGSKSIKRQQHDDEISQDLIPAGFAREFDSSLNNPSPPKRVCQGAADDSSYFQEDVRAGLASTTKKRTAEEAAVSRSGAASSRQQKSRKVSQ
jgi:hypothetical protein